MKNGVFSGIALACVFLVWGQPQQALMAILILVTVAWTMIYRPNWWTFWMPFGFWEQLASDKDQADQQGLVIVFSGWLLLLGMLLFALLR